MEITELLQRVHDGEEDALNELIPLVYDELKKLASSQLRRQGGAGPLDTTALVHEAYLRMAGANHPSYENRSHFYGIASRVMRLILVDAARAKYAAKRSAAEVPLTEIPDEGSPPEAILLAMHEALQHLETADPLKAQLLDMHYFGGMTAEESGTALSMSASFVRRELRLAQAWLRRELAGE